MIDYIDWTGLSGSKYRYWFLPGINGPFKAEGGNYTFVRPSGSGLWLPVYFGETNDFSTRLPDHERWADALRAGATHIMAHTTPAGERVRLNEETDLIKRWNPPLNAQMRRTS